ISGGVCCCTSDCDDDTYHTTTKPKYGMLARNTSGVGASAPHANELPSARHASPTVVVVGLRRYRDRRKLAARLVTAFSVSAMPNRLGCPNVRLAIEAKNVAKLNTRSPTSAFASSTALTGGVCHA